MYVYKTVDVETLLKSRFLDSVKKLWDLRSVQFYVHDFPFLRPNLETNDEINAHFDLGSATKVLTLLAADSEFEVDLAASLYRTGYSLQSILLLRAVLRRNRPTYRRKQATAGFSWT